MKPFAIYFPQFYPTPTNNRAWGQGFTDWMLVADANLHERWQRRAPARGFYDGSQPELHLSQIQQIRDFGLGGFALYHYWFYTHQELGAFERTLLTTPGSDVLPWFVIWATEGWSRRWLGDPTPIAVLTTDPGQAEIERHCDYLARCFDHPSYLRWNGRSVFIWYHLQHFDRPGEVVEKYRDALARRHHEFLLGHFVKNPFDIQNARLAEISYLFEPRLFFGTRRVGRGLGAKKVFDGFKSLIGESRAAQLIIFLDRFQQSGLTYRSADFLAYMASIERAQLVQSIPGRVQEVVTPGWNNTPRYGSRFTALQDLGAEDFGRLVVNASLTDALPPLINAWNEWSEGAAIEPCAYLGTRYLDALGAVDRQLTAAARSGEPVGSGS